MRFTQLMPDVFYAEVRVGLALFVDALGFTKTYDALHEDEPFCVVERDGLALRLVQDAVFAAKDRPQLRLRTDDIEAVFHAVVSRAPQLLHPNAKVIAERPWGAKEFALRDASDVCVIVQQWPA